jgi:hypothetical protein
VSIYIFTHEAWAEPEMLHRYVGALNSASEEDRSFREAFEKAVRGFYRRDQREEEGRIGPIDQGAAGGDTPGTAAFRRLLFKEPVTHAAGPARDATHAP